MFYSFIIVLAVCTTGAAQTLEPAVINTTNFTDVTLFINVDGLKAPELGELAFFLKEISHNFDIGDELDFKASVCVQFQDWHNGNWRLLENVPRDLTPTAATNIIQRIDAQREKTGGGNCDQQRHRGAHTAKVSLVRDQHTSFEKGRTSAAMNKARDDLGNDMARIVIKDFKQSADFAAVVVVGDNDTEFYKDLSLQYVSAKLVNTLWKSLQKRWSQCTYTSQPGSSCFYVEGGKCVHNKSYTKNSGWSIPDDCVGEFVQLRPCSETECESECKKRLNEVPCFPSCGKGKKLLSTTDLGTMYCKERSMECSNPNSCSWVAGAAMMGIGFTFFLFSGVGLLILWLLSKRKAPLTPMDAEASKKNEVKEKSAKKDGGPLKGKSAKMEPLKSDLKTREPVGKHPKRKKPVK